MAIGRLVWHRQVVPRRPLEIVYRDTVSRGPSRIGSLPGHGIQTYAHSHKEVEATPDNRTLRSLILGKRRAYPQSKHQRNSVQSTLDTPTKSTHLDTNLYSRRHKFPGYKTVLQMLKKGAIVEAMTRFYIASRSWQDVYQGRLPPGESDFEISPHIINDLLERLSRLATAPAWEWKGTFQKTNRTSYWIPAQMRKGQHIQTMDVQTLGFYALLDVYDIGGSLGLSPDSTAMSATLHAISHHVDAVTFSKCVHLMILRLGGLSLQDAEVEFASSRSTPLKADYYRLLPPVLLKAILEGFGRLGLPHIGEALAHDWSMHIATKVEQNSTNRNKLEEAWQNASDGKQQSVGKPVWINSSGWSSDIGIWVALIRSRISSSDLAGARHWLQRYRQEGLESAQALQDGRCAGPHIAYIFGLSSIQFSKMDTSDDVLRDAKTFIENGKTRYQALCDVIKLMHHDGVPMSVDLLILSINVHIGYNHLENAIPLIRLLFKQESEAVTSQPTFYKMFFHLHRAVYIRQPLDIHQLSKLAEESDQGKLRSLGDLRSLYQEFIYKIPFKSKLWSRQAIADTLTEALRASLASGDYPLASHVLLTFQKLKMPSDEKVQWLVAKYLSSENRPKASKIAKWEEYRRAVGSNLRALLKENQGKETPFEETIITTEYAVDNAQDQKITGYLIKIVTSRIVQDIQVALNSSPTSKDPAWLHDAWQTLHQRTKNSHNDIAKVALSPILKSLRQKKKEY